MIFRGVQCLAGAIVLVLLLISESSAQTFIVQPATAENSDGEYETRLLLKKDVPFRLNWSQLDGSLLDLTASGSQLIIGRSSNLYDVLEVPVSGLQADITPNEVELSAGRYYARITNSESRTTTDIVDDQEANPASILYSNEILLLIEADEAPAIIEPRGTITDPVPTFRWSPVAGVPAYFILVSSTPFDIIEEDNGDIGIEGATIVWQYITSQTSGIYGAINEESQIGDIAPPLNDGQEYSYTVLNAYEENNPVFTSPVFGGIVPFVFSDPEAIGKATLLSPSDDEEFFSEQTITFEWTEVPNAANYTINLFQIVRQQGVDVSLPLWSSTTTNTIIDYPALLNLKNGSYKWNVIANNEEGGGTTSEDGFFTYNVETGAFRVEVKNELDGSSVQGVELSVRAISGGVTPGTPFAIQNESYKDSLVVGTYEFSAVKEGFEDGITERTINEGRTTQFIMNLTPLPSSVNGTVEDENGVLIQNAVIEVNGLSTDFNQNYTSNINGEFAISLNEGSYTLDFSKSGYISPEQATITLDLNEQRTIATPFILTNDQATVSGFVFNEEGDPVQRAEVTISDETSTSQVNTDGTGFYQFTVASGSWSITAEKVGFVKPDEIEINLSTGDVLQNQDFVLVGNANQITGFVRERITNSDGSTGTAPFEDVLVTAIPTIGEPVSVRTERSGQYTLSLKSGSYTIKAEQENYTSNQERELVIGIAVGETISGMDFELIPNPSSVAGTITLPDGNGVADATVTIESIGQTTTSSSGFYQIGVPEGSHVITVNKTGLVSPEPRNVSVVVGQNLAGVDFELIPNAGSVSGRVTSGGEAVSNSRVTAVNTGNGSRNSLLNNLDGTYTFNLSSGSWYIKAEKDGFISDSTTVLSVGPGQQIVNQNLSLIENLATLRGTITDGSSPIRNATVTLSKAGNQSFSQSTVSQINGTYAFTLAAGEVYTILIEKEGYKNSIKQTELLIAGATENIDFELEANPSSVSGTVRVGGDDPLVNAKIIAINSSGIREDSTFSDSDGNYLLGLNPGSYSLIAVKPGYTTESINTTLEIGENIENIDFSVSENFVLFNGTITDTNGNGLEQVFVNVTGSSKGASSTTDQDGSFSISGLVGGIYQVELSKSGFIEKTEEYTTEDGDFITISESLIEKNGSISGRVTEENGIVINGATVSAVSSSGITYTGISDNQGQYSINSVELSTFTVNASKTGFTSSAAIQVTVDEINLTVSGADITNLIPNNAIVRGVVKNEKSGNPLKDVQVSVTGTRGSGFDLSGSDGSFEISNLIPSEYSLVLFKEGFKADTSTINIEAGSPVLVADRSLSKNNGSISGRVVDPSGNSLSFRARIVLASANEQRSQQTDEDGFFAFQGLETNVGYTVETDIFREGYENVSKEVFLPLGVDELTLADDLEVIVNQGVIRGGTGTNRVSIKLLNANTLEIVELTSSSIDSAYTFDFLPAGEYIVEANKLGFVFNPGVSSVISLDFDEEVTQNFAAQANIGSIKVKTENEDGNPVSNVDIIIISADTSVIRTRNTNSSGVVVFKDVKASTDYTIRASKSGFVSVPATQQLRLNTGTTDSTVFTLSSNLSQLNGIVQLENNGSFSNLRDVTVRASLLNTGQNFGSTTNASGAYNFGSLSSGSYRLIATREGFTTDTALVQLQPGEDVLADTLVVNRASVDLRGRVLFKGAGVSGVRVQALGSSSFETETNNSGDFRFSSLPISTAEGDTTRYQIIITSGVFSRRYTVDVAPNKVGTRVNVPVTNLPSGQILLTVTDGLNPLGGAVLEFGIAGGETERIVTGNNGNYISANNLRRATYVVSVSKQGFLVPQNTIRYVLESDTSVLNEEILLPYTQLKVNKILADQPTKIAVINQPGFNNIGASATLSFRRASRAQFTEINMTVSGDSLLANIPAQNSTEPITFFTTVKDTVLDNTFLSREQTIRPLASGILSNIRVNPSLKGQTLRVGETYNLELLVRDGINASLQEQFTSGGMDEGTILWENLSDTTGISLINQEGTKIQLLALKAGSYNVNVEASLDGAIVSTNVNIEVSDIPLREIVVSSPAKQLSNSASHLFAYAAFDTSGNSVLLGQGLRWNVIPATAGSIDSRGVFTPSNTNLLGTFAISVEDTVSGLVGITDQIELVARVEPTEEYTLSNGEGLELNLPIGSVDIPSFVSLTESVPPPTKKFVFAQGSDQSYIVGDRVFALAFEGSELRSTARLTLPTDSTISQLNLGDREIARFNFITLQWEILETLPGKASAGFNTGTIATDRLGQFAVLSANQPLQIRNAAILPTPFSPDIAPAKIGYWLDTAFPPARVTIKIYNIRGELVRTLFEDDLQQPGRYGSDSSMRPISWDGLTDAGTMARNGRYVVQIKAKDQQDEQVKLLQIVLIK